MELPHEVREAQKHQLIGIEIAWGINIERRNDMSILRQEEQ